MQIGKINVSYSNDNPPSGVRQTSIDCYNQIKAEGLLSKRRMQALEYMIKIAPCTASELQDSMPYDDGGRDCMKRISELLERGVVVEAGVKKCKVTGRQVTVWDLTDNLPVEVATKPSRKQERANVALEALRELYKNKESREKWLEVAELIKKI